VPLGISKQKIIWIPNGVDLSMFTQTPDPIHSDDFTLMYFGAHGHANGLWDILQAMSFVQQSSNGAKINLRLIGEGSLKPLLIAESLKLGLKNIFFESSVPKNEISALASKADAFVLSVIDLPNLYKYGISMNKMFDYLAASRPILIASNAINNPVADAHAGITVAPGNPQALAEAILKIASTSLEERIRMGRAGRDYVKKNHDFVQLSAKLATVLNEVCAEVDNK
jgi:glycosyltransferase involved in cell wall biosynthesis